MTTPLIEAIARKQCEQHIREVRRWDTDPAKLEAVLPGAVDVNWQDHVALAQAALTAIEAAGYAVVPVEPTEAMCDAALRYVPRVGRPGMRGMYLTMISAAQGDG